MDFGDWLRQLRTTKKLDLSTVAQRTGVDISTLSRLENHRTEPTLETVIKICDGFQVDMAALLRQLVGDAVLERVQPGVRRQDRPQPVLTLDHVRRFYGLFRADPLAACDLIADLLQTATNSEIHINRDVSRYRRSIMPDYDAFYILRSMLPEPIYHVELAYPSDFDAYDVLLTYQNNGVLTFSDVGIYIRAQRRSQNQTIAGIEKAVNRSASVLSRIEGGVMGKIKLSAALELDQQLGIENEILGMFWDAAQFQSLSRRKVAVENDEIQLMAVGTALITVFRWHQVQQPGSDAWLTRLSTVLDTAQHPPEE